MAIALVIGVTSGAAATLNGLVGAAYNISGPSGVLAPGTYDLVVDDQTPNHNFHLSGPGVDVVTSVAGTGTTTFSVTLQLGTYTYVCDPHDTMRGSFTVGEGSPLTPAAAPPAAPPPAPQPPPQSPPLPRAPGAPTTKLLLTVGPKLVISLRTASGKTVQGLKPGTYSVEVRDRSVAHNAHLHGAGINRKTGVIFKGTLTWRLTLRKGTLTFLSDPHKRDLRGSIKVL